MNIAAEVRNAFAGHAIGRPCTDEELLLAEKQLGHPLPESVRRLYREMNGFVGPTGAQFLFPLLEDAADPARASLVGHTLFLRSEDYFPRFLSRIVAVGDDGTGPTWLILLDQPDKVALWDAEWGEEFEWLDGSLLDVWLKAKAMYDALLKST